METLTTLPHADHHEAEQKPFEYEILDDSDLRYEYVNLTKNLISKVMDEKADSLIFLDKSARPVSWLVRSLWDSIAIEKFDEQGKPVIAAMPEMKFLNIDKEQWMPSMGRHELVDGADITLDNVHSDTIDSLTGVFTERSLEPQDYVDKDEPTMFDDKNIMIIDEVCATDLTRKIAHTLVKTAFQNAASIKSTHWMSPATSYDRKSGGRINSKTPVWYSNYTPHGRLVADRDQKVSSESNSVRQRRGAQFLSTRFPEIDERGVQLRQEMKQLGRDVKAGKMPVAPQSNRSREFKVQFVESVNNLSINEFARLRQQSEKENSSFADVVNEYKAARAAS